LRLSLLSATSLSSHLVARPSIKTETRGSLGARDRRRTMDISGPCLEQGSTARRTHSARRQSGPNLPRFGTRRNRWCAGVSRTKSRTTGQGFAALLKEYPPGLSSFGGGLVVSNGFLSNNRDVVAKVVHALLEALAMCLGGRNKVKVMQAFNSALSITDEKSAASSLGELRRKPYPSWRRWQRLQRYRSMILAC
jgi:hypothetical protein